MNNQYPPWKNLLIAVVIVLGMLYALPNLYGEDPAIQISGVGSTSVGTGTLDRAEAALKQAGLPYSRPTLGPKGAKLRFVDTETQLRAKDLVEKTLGERYTVALNLEPATPAWLSAIGAKPMYLGLDLRGGVHFLMEVDMKAAIRKAMETEVGDLRHLLGNANVGYLSVDRESDGLHIAFQNEASLNAGRRLIERHHPDLILRPLPNHRLPTLLATLSPAAIQKKQHFALVQNVTALRRRVNDLGVAQPIIEQQGKRRIVVELPGVQDTARAKQILGRTATLAVKMVDESHSLAAALAGNVPPGDKVYYDRYGHPILLKRHTIYSGDDIVDASAGFDNQTSQPVVSITLDARGAARNERVTRRNVNKRMAVVYEEIRSHLVRDAQGRPVLKNGHEVMRTHRIEQVITAPVIREPIGARFQITGIGSIKTARDLALLLRAGALAAPVKIIEERTVGPSLGAANIRRGFDSTMIGFAAIAVFMIVYYRFFGLIAAVALVANMMLLVALLSLLQATLTLPGIAGIALTVGMAIDANVLIFERIREELRAGNTPQASINTGYERALATIIDSNITTLIAGLALLWLGSGPVRGFAVTLCIGIMTSMFTGVMVSRALVNAYYGRRRRLSRIAI
ncbi:MAG: protein translocase subunit SecD [Acidiferrobacteraceae bacterium]